MSPFTPLSEALYGRASADYDPLMLVYTAVPPICTSSLLLLYLLGLLSRFLLRLLTSRLRGLWSGLGVHDIIPPSEATRIIADKLLVVNIMMLSTGPERQEVVQAPREFVAAVCIDGLK